MKPSTISIGIILLSMAVLNAKATSTCSCSCGGHDENPSGKCKKEEIQENPAPRVKQCTFKSLARSLDKGQIQTLACDFQKAHSNSSLRVTYQGDLRLVSCSGCCRRWFITINGKECSSPAPIDAVILSTGVNGLNLHRPGTLDGFCNNIPKGRVTVGLSLGICHGYTDKGDAHTCWNSVCRFIVEEIPSLQ